MTFHGKFHGCFFLQFPSAIVNVYFWREDWAMFILDFEVFIKFPHFLTYYVLSHLASCEATLTFNIVHNDTVPIHLK